MRAEWLPESRMRRDLTTKKTQTKMHIEEIRIMYMDVTAHSSATMK